MRGTSILTASCCGLLAAALWARGGAEETRVLDVGAARTIDIVLDGRNFTPIDLYHNGGDVVPITWRGCKAADIMSKLKKNKPAAITREPRYQGFQQLYGSLALGSRKNNRHYFALDVKAPDDMVMYFDFRNDGRLDEAPPLRNQGSFKKGENGFATLIELPWDQLVEDSPYHGKFMVWFILNSFQWANTGFSHASHTQLKGKLDIGGGSYTVIIADRAENDADGDLTNDGLYLKRGEGEPRYISAEEARAGVVLDGRRYRFRVRYKADRPR